MEPGDILPRIVGIFYLLSGMAGLHVMAMDVLMDKALAAITLKPTPGAEIIRRRLLTSGSFAVGVSGAALMVLSLWAVPLFLLAGALQLGWLLWAHKGYPTEGELDEKGRRQTTMAAIIYGTMTAAVVWLGVSGRLFDWRDPWALFIPVAALALGLFGFRHMVWNRRRRPTWDKDEPAPQYQIPPAPPRVLLAPTWGFYPLRNADNDDGIAYGDYLPEELADRLYVWTLAFHGSDDDQTREYWAWFDTPEDEAAHRLEGAALVPELAAIFGEAEGPVYPDDIRYGTRPERD